ncbi:unnamed protein product [Fraxinus pennsylvanica]|uniref:Uncharacterized protein n=1 Tax=Fraxinus pennsylvanica TaxID=56036 RepID=A0AAD1Z7N2_9LAMI|nr:unnamed protein product [Fraxinus pennsylvanica]
MAKKSIFLVAAAGYGLSSPIFSSPPNFVWQLIIEARRSSSNIGVAQVAAASWSNNQQTSGLTPAAKAVDTGPSAAMAPVEVETGVEEVAAAVKNSRCNGENVQLRGLASFEICFFFEFFESTITRLRYHSSNYTSNAVQIRICPVLGFLPMAKKSNILEAAGYGLSSLIFRFPPNFVLQLSNKTRRNCGSIVWLKWRRRRRLRGRITSRYQDSRRRLPWRQLRLKPALRRWPLRSGFSRPEIPSYGENVIFLVAATGYGLSSPIFRSPPNFVWQLSIKARRNSSNIGVAQVAAASWSNNQWLLNSLF